MIQLECNQQDHYQIKYIGEGNGQRLQKGL